MYKNNRSLQNTLIQHVFGGLSGFCVVYGFVCCSKISNAKNLVQGMLKNPGLGDVKNPGLVDAKNLIKIG